MALFRRTIPQPKPVGLILSGGGARAAYQIGVLRAVANILPKDASNPFDVICGTSAGALNAASLASHCNRLRTGVRTLEAVWRNLSSDKIYDPESASLLSSASGIILGMLTGRSSDSPVALLDNEPLMGLLQRVIRLDRIQTAIDNGQLRAISVTASAYGTGESMSFYQGREGLQDWQGPHRIGVRSQLTLEHLMASSAIPVIFPSVRIGNQYFGDGAVRQLAPTSPALHLGARRILAIGVSANRTKPPLLVEQEEQPSLSQILGHIMNSAFVDTLENDLEFLRAMNELIPHVSPRNMRRHNLPYSEIELLEVSPSEELNLMAMNHYDELPKQMARYVKEDSSGTLLSLILFEKGFCSALCDLGLKDAMEKAQEIADFFRVKYPREF